MSSSNEAPPTPRGFEVTPLCDGQTAPDGQADWLRGVAERLQQPDGYIGAMFSASRRSGRPEEWRLLAYIGDSWETAGDGWRAIELTGDDPISRRDEAAVETLWRGAIEDSRKEHEAMGKVDGKA